MDGVKQRMDPGEPNRGNMYEMPVETMREKGIQVVPQSRPEALAARGPAANGTLRCRFIFGRISANGRASRWLR